MISFGSSEMLLHEPKASAITFPNCPKKVILHEPQCNCRYIYVLLYDKITEVLLKIFFLCKT